LGEIMGRRQAFWHHRRPWFRGPSRVLRRIRDQKLYLSRAATWDEFRLQQLDLSRAHANRIIHPLEEFGPTYSEVAQPTRITPQQFREIAPAVRDQRIHSYGEAITLIQENADLIAAASGGIARSRKSRAQEHHSRQIG
jgi:hypothetical protein